MKSKYWKICCFLGALLLGAAVLLGGRFLPFKKTGSQATNFSLLDQNGRLIELRYFSDAKKITLVSYQSNCPWLLTESKIAPSASNSSPTENNEFIFFINSDGQDLTQSSFSSPKKLSANHFLLFDNQKIVSKLYNFKNCGDTITINPQSWEVVSRAQAPPLEAKKNFPLEFQEEVAVSYHKTVAPLLAAKCMICHRSGGIAPWSMDSYERVKGWAPMIREVLLTKRMPPWSFNPHLNVKISNAWQLTDAENSALLHWVNAGSRNDAPEKADPLPMEMAKYQGRPKENEPKPDFSFTLPVDRIPASGRVDLFFSDFNLNFKEDKWVRAAYVIPSNKKVLHHAFLFVDYPETLKKEQPVWAGDKRSYLENTNGFFAEVGPAGSYKNLWGEFPAGTGKFIPKGSKARLQIHYSPTGKEETNQLTVELYFHKKKPAKELKTYSPNNMDIAIPPRVKEHLYETKMSFPKGAYVYETLPHMHYRGKWMDYFLRLPNGSEELFFSVPKYRIYWQATFRFKEPVYVPPGGQVVVRGAFDNSTQNPLNPDPNKEVHYGLLTTDEMFMPYLGYVDAN